MGGRHGPIVATIPADRSFWRVLRLLASNVAACSGLGFDKIDDVAMATNEAVCLVAGVPGTTSITCRAVGDADSVEITLAAVPSSAVASAPWPDELADRVLRAVADDVHFSSADASVRFRIAAR